MGTPIRPEFKPSRSSILPKTTLAPVKASAKYSSFDTEGASACNKLCCSSVSVPRSAKSSRNFWAALSSGSANTTSNAITSAPAISSFSTNCDILVRDHGHWPSTFSERSSISTILMWSLGFGLINSCMRISNNTASNLAKSVAVKRSVLS